MCQLDHCALLQYGSFLNNDEGNTVDKTCGNSSDLQAVPLTKVTRMRFSVIFPIPMELTVIITYLLMLTQQYLTFPLIWSWCCCCYGWPCCSTVQSWWTEIGACQLESELIFVTTKELWELSRSLPSIMMHMSLMETWMSVCFLLITACSDGNQAARSNWM